VQRYNSCWIKDAVKIKKMQKNIVVVKKKLQNLKEKEGKCLCFKI